MKAEVTTSGMAWQLSLRAYPNMSAEKVHVIAAGRDMVILDGPVCADNSYCGGISVVNRVLRVGLVKEIMKIIG